MSERKQLLVMPSNRRFDAAQTAELKEAGFVVVYLKDPSQARVLSAEPNPIPHSQFLLAALRSVRTSDDYKGYRELVDNLIRAVMAEDARQQTDSKP